MQNSPLKHTTYRKTQDQRTHRTPQPCMHTHTHIPPKTHRIATQTKHTPANTPLHVHSNTHTSITKKN